MHPCLKCFLLSPGSYHRSDLGTYRQRRLHRPGGGAGPSGAPSATPSSSSGGVPVAGGGGRERGRPGAIPTSTPSDTPLHSLNAHGRPPVRRKECMHAPWRGVELRLEAHCTNGMRCHPGNGQTCGAGSLGIAACIHVYGTRQTHE